MNDKYKRILKEIKDMSSIGERIYKNTGFKYCGYEINEDKGIVTFKGETSFTVEERDIKIEDLDKYRKGGK